MDVEINFTLYRVKYIKITFLLRPKAIVLNDF